MPYEQYQSAPRLEILNSHAECAAGAYTSQALLDLGGADVHVAGSFQFGGLLSLATRSVIFHFGDVLGLVDGVTIDVQVGYTAPGLAQASIFNAAGAQVVGTVFATDDSFQALAIVYRRHAVMPPVVGHEAGVHVWVGGVRVAYISDARLDLLTVFDLGIVLQGDAVSLYNALDDLQLRNL